jgi:C4-dicarboxylate transporter DctM subunit
LSVAPATHPDSAAHSPEAARGAGWRQAENALLALALGAMVLLPLAEAALRPLDTGVPGASSFLQHLTLVVGMLGAALAARENRLLSLSTLQAFLRGRPLAAVRWLAAVPTVVVAAMLCVAAWQFVQSEREAGGNLVSWLPLWWVQLILPIGFAAITLRAAVHAGPSWAARAGAVAAAVALVALMLMLPLPRDTLVWAGLAGIVLALVLGAPVFVALGGAALLLFWGVDLPVASLAVDHYRLVVNPSLPAIPLFTLAGYLLAESGAPKRLIRVFNALFGRARGSAAAVAICAGAFFTAFTGGSGVTILALGGLLLPLLIGVGQSERNALGLITSGSGLGVLLPPSLPLILFAIVAKVPMDQMFLGALLPGLVLMALLFVLGWRNSRPASHAPRAPAGELRQALWAAKWELLLPVVAFGALFGGFATPVEAAAFTALYALLLTTVLHRDLNLVRDVPRVSAEAGLVIGSVLLILGVALGFTNYLVDAQVPDRLVEWTTANIESRWVFLAVLNLSLLLVGCFMDAFSAIVVVVPIIVPVAAAFGIDPIHLGVIFLANMELGYLTPLVGMNLFFASYRFGKPVLEVARAVLPYMLVILVGVVVVTYVPWLTSVLPTLAGR